MEHLFLFLFTEFPIMLDRRWRRSSRREIPEFDLLLDSPADYFARHDYARFGPGHLWPLGAMLGLLAANLSMCAAVVGLDDLDPNKRLIPRALAVTILLGSPVITFAVVNGICRYFFRGGEVVLGEAGVVFRYRGREVACPWGLFATGGAIEQTKSYRVLVPVREGYVTGITAADRGRSIEWSELTGKPVRFTRYASGNREALAALLDDVYVCHLTDVADTIRQVAPVMADRAATRF